MRLALFADVHGNKWALEAVYQAIQKAKPDMIIFLGDALLRVPAPRESIQMIREMSDISVRGNYDWMMVGGFPGEKRRFELEPFLIDEIAWTKQQITADDLKYLEAMPLTVRLFEGTNHEVVISHASPGQAFGGIFPAPELHHWGMTDEQCLKLLRDERAPTVLAAHTHAVMDRQIDRWRVINPGSVSLGWNEQDELDPLARWSLMTLRNGEWEVDFRAESYPVNEAWKAYENWPLWPKLQKYEKPRWWGENLKAFAT